MLTFLFTSLLIVQTFSTLHGVEEFSELMKKEYVLVDVRTPEEFAQGALPKAINVSITSLSFSFEITKLDKEKPVLIYCKSGTRSARAALAMKALGFAEIHELKGGYMAWQTEKSTH